MKKESKKEEKKEAKKDAKKPEKYNKVRLLGEGAYGRAFLVTTESTGEYCVIKEIDIHSMSSEMQKETLKEAKIMEGLSHPNIVTFREVYKTKKGTLCIVMDYADGNVG
jgi:NIMA (never in mitosis gene a)-related kinase